MICEMYNKMHDVENFVLFCGDKEIGKECNTKVTPIDFIKECFVFVLGCVFIFWWFYPILKTCLWIYNKFVGWTEKITFKCKKEK